MGIKGRRLTSTMTEKTKRLSQRPVVTAVWVVALLLASPTAATAGECIATSGPKKVALLELYTSEGCSSCPPADRWLSGLARRTPVPSSLLPLAFHVDYWNDLGWRDPFSQAKFSDRQREHSRRRNQRFVVTPQFLLDGQPYSPALLIDDIARRAASINRSRPRADLRMRLTAAPDRMDFSVEARATDPDARQSALLIALYENRLQSSVEAGENRGAKLAHDYVVRALVGPFAFNGVGVASHSASFLLDSRWKTGDLHLAAFVQHPRTGEVMQALAATCP